MNPLSSKSTHTDTAVRANNIPENTEETGLLGSLSEPSKVIYSRMDNSITGRNLEDPIHHTTVNIGDVNDNVLSDFDPEISSLIKEEDHRQKSVIRLIPSENYESQLVRQAYNNPFGNKYSEGYPHKWVKGIKKDVNARYYHGQIVANKLEKLVSDRLISLFVPGCESDYHANIQPLSGAPANLTVLNAFLEKDDTFMGLSLDFGGHLTHGHKVSITSKFFNPVQYPLGKDNTIDFSIVRKIALESRPKVIFCGATAYSRTIDFKSFGEIAKEVGAILVADISHINGLIIAGEHPHPFPHADVITSTTHKLLRGPRGGFIISKLPLGERIDKSLFPGIQGGPHLNMICALGVALKEAATSEYRKYASQVKKNAKALCDELSRFGFNIVGKTTENHMIVIDVKNSDPNVSVENGSIFADWAEQGGIVLNKNSVPGDEKPWIPSGVRIGTPATTTLGMKESDMKKIAFWLKSIAMSKGDEAILSGVKKDVEVFMKRFDGNQVGE